MVAGTSVIHICHSKLYMYTLVENLIYSNPTDRTPTVFRKESRCQLRPTTPTERDSAPPFLVRLLFAIYRSRVCCNEYHRCL